MRWISSCLIVATVLLLSGCLPKEPLLSITAAENIRRTSDGRLFVTGHAGLFEILPTGDNQFEAFLRGTSDQPCNYYAGLAQLHDWLFFSCVRQSQLSLRELNFNVAGELLAYSLVDGSIEPVMELSGYQFSNGLDALPSENAILIADEDFLLARGGVSKARIDFSSKIPVLIDYEHDWINASHEVYAANGVRVVDNAVYLTDIGFFKKVELNPDGSPGQAQILYRNLTVLDDFDVACNGNGFLIADFVKGHLVYVPKDDSPAVITPSGLNSPSAVLGDPGPIFGEDSVLVTESRGLRAGTGNQLVRVPKSQLGIEGC